MHCVFPAYQSQQERDDCVWLTGYPVDEGPLDAQACI
jgi:hypothetical protein